MKSLVRYLMFAVLFAYAVVSLFPLLNLIFQAFKPEKEILAKPFRPPSVWTGEHFGVLWSKYEFSRYTFNSLLVTIVSMAAVLLLSVMAGYAFARLRFFGSKFHFAVLLGTLLVPGSLLIVPVYVLGHQLDILNSYVGLIFPYVSGVLILPVILLRGAFQAIPGDLIDAAKMDGCGEFRTLFSVLTPVVAPMIGSVCILSFPGIWNEFIWAQVSLNSEKLFTLPIAMAKLAANAYSVGFGTVYAGLFLLTMPLIAIFLLAQRAYVSAITDGAIKG